MYKELDINEITKEVIVELAKKVSVDICDRIKGYFKDAKIKGDIDLGSCYENYLNASLKNYSKVKTLIYRHEPKNLYSFYECIGVRCDKKEIDTNSIHNIIDIGNKLIITGTGGIGKTTMLKHFFINTIKETNLIPVLVELRKLNEKDLKEISIIDTIYESLTNFGLNIEKKYFEYSMEVGCYIFLFDGYDEIKQDYTLKITEGISNLCDKYPENYYILSSRPTEDFLGWNDFIEMSALPLNKEQALSLVKKLEYDEEVKNIFYKELESTLYNKYRSFASNPLLLTIMLLTFDNRASIPDKLNDFYEQAFATLYNIHDATKGGFKREIRCGLGYEDFKLIFAYICFKSYFEDQYEFTEKSIREYIEKAKQKYKENIKFEVDDFKEDLVKSVCMLVREGLNYRFSHRSFQEYFAAWYTCKLTDDVLEKLIISWIKESMNYRGDSYLSMLFNLQSERFNKIILCPGIKKIRDLYNQSGILSVFKELFGEVAIRTIYERSESESKGKSRSRLLLRIKDQYLSAILSTTCELNSFKYKSNTDKTDEKLLKLLEEKFPSERFISFEKLEEEEIIEEVLDKFRLVEEQVKFSINLLEKIEGSSIGNKRKLMSILEQL